MSYNQQYPSSTRRHCQQRYSHSTRSNVTPQQAGFNSQTQASPGTHPGHLSTVYNPQGDALRHTYCPRHETHHHYENSNTNAGPTGPSQAYAVQSPGFPSGPSSHNRDSHAVYAPPSQLASANSRAGASSSRRTDKPGTITWSTFVGSNPPQQLPPGIPADQKHPCVITEPFDKESRTYKARFMSHNSPHPRMRTKDVLPARFGAVLDKDETCPSFIHTNPYQIPITSVGGLVEGIGRDRMSKQELAESQQKLQQHAASRSY